MKKLHEKQQAKKLLESLTQKEVAKRLNVTEKTVGSWVKEFKKEKISIETLTKKVIELENEVKELKELVNVKIK